METTTKTPSAARARSSALDMLGQLAGWAAVCGAAFYGWHLYSEANEHETDTWLEQTSAIRDPWQRHEELWRGHALHTDDQRKRVDALLHTSLVQALSERSESAYEFLDKREAPGSPDTDELFDQYPRSPDQRAAQTATLRLVWPQLASMRVFDRAALLRMAERCHLHEAAAPVERQTVLDCLRFGAQSRGTESVLGRLMDTAELGHSLTSTP